MLYTFYAIPRITAKFKEVSNLHPTGHAGVDVAVDVGTELAAIGDGTIEKVYQLVDTGVGRGIMLKLDNGYRALYGHLSSIKVKPGQRVSAGDLIGLSGNTGRSTGPHLHLQLFNPSGKVIDPTKFIDEALEVTTSWDPFGLGAKIDGLQNSVDNFTYWINPINWVKEGWDFLGFNMRTGALDVPFMAASIILIWLIIFGAKWPKKTLYWGWLGFWTLRGVVFHG